MQRYTTGPLNEELPDIPIPLKTLISPSRCNTSLSIVLLSSILTIPTTRILAVADSTIHFAWHMRHGLMRILSEQASIYRQHFPCIFILLSSSRLFSCLFCITTNRRGNLFLYSSILRRSFQYCEKRLLSLSCLLVRPSVRNNWAPTGRITIKFDISRFFKVLEEN